MPQPLGTAMHEDSDANQSQSTAAATHACAYSPPPQMPCLPAGIDVCGARVVKMILDCIQLLQSEGRQVTKLSFVGYSLGGLILRCVPDACSTHMSLSGWAARCA